MRNPFTEHPNSVGETYGQHALFAMRYGVKMTVGGLAAFVHGLLPFLFRTTGSRITDELSATLAAARERGRTVKDETKP
ncbi:hypothetical protein BWI17_08315 [Betaproteobacteria bacterium GR16-43]|nr:hypothetical protein BWI17_08315 [Betaproteobacteria bacterium GR16-43]